MRSQKMSGEGRTGDNIPVERSKTVFAARSKRVSSKIYTPSSFQ